MDAKQYTETETNTKQYTERECPTKEAVKRVMLNVKFYIIQMCLFQCLCMLINWLSTVKTECMHFHEGCAP